jgi:hypothetical protein
MTTATDKQTENKRADGKFAPGNKLGRKFEPGQSGNPAGRPKSITLSEAYRYHLAQPVPKDPQGRTYAEVIAELMCQRATQGDVAAAKELADRVDGRARQALDVDMKVTDWREMARAHGLNFEDIIREAQRLIESEPATDSSDA